MKVPVFDIDWTVLAKREPNIHERAFFYAFETVYGLKLTDRPKAEGRTDNQIIIETMTFNKVPREEILSKLKIATKTMSEYFNLHKDDGAFEVMPGVVDLLISLKKMAIPIGLLTGNVKEIGWGKLEKAGIKDYFSFGAFGDSGFTRPDLIPIAATEASKFLKYNVNESDLVVIGDTILDIECAKFGGALSIGVATGPVYSVKDLEDAGADFVVNSLKEKDKILNFLEA